MRYTAYVSRKKRAAKTYLRRKKMKNEVKFCVVCGRKIPEISMRRKTCSNFCARRKKGGYAPYLFYKNPPYEDLTSIQKKAQNASMSYGKYVACTESRGDGR